MQHHSKIKVLKSVVLSRLYKAVSVAMEHRSSEHRTFVIEINFKSVVSDFVTQRQFRQHFHVDGRDKFHPIHDVVGTALDELGQH